MQATLGDADPVEPRSFLGLNDKKKREWESWNAIRGVTSADAKEMLVNTCLDLGVVKDERPFLQKQLDDYMKKHVFIDYQRLLPLMLIGWIMIKNVASYRHAYTAAKMIGGQIKPEHVAKGAQAVARMGGMKLDFNKTLAVANAADYLMKEVLVDTPAL